MHRSPDVWGPDCETFNHDRPEYRGDAALLDEYAYTTFSQGLHRCPGQALALRTIECVVARLLVQRAALATRPLPPVSFERATLAQRAAPVAVRVSVDNVPYNVD